MGSMKLTVWCGRTVLCFEYCTCELVWMHTHQHTFRLCWCTLQDSSVWWCETLREHVRGLASPETTRAVGGVLPWLWSHWWRSALSPARHRSVHPQAAQYRGGTGTWSCRAHCGTGRHKGLVSAGIRQCLEGKQKTHTCWLCASSEHHCWVVYQNRRSRSRTQTWKSYSLCSITSGTYTAVTSDCVLTDLSVATHVASIVALVNIWRKCS